MNDTKREEVNEQERWAAYFNATCKRPPSATAVDALKQLEAVDCKNAQIIDIGCGAGVDTLYFLNHDYSVLAVDGQIEGITRVKSQLPVSQQSRLQISMMRFEELKLPKEVDCIIANYSLPFCNPTSFTKMWKEIVDSLKTNGIFSGVFFGNRDQWAVNSREGMTFFTDEQVKELLQGLQVISYEESEYEGYCCGEHGEDIEKHWHIFKVIIKK